MFGFQDELTKQIPNKMVVSIIGCNYLHESIINTCLNINEGDYINRFKFNSLLNTDQLIYKKKDKENYSLGLLNLDWIRKCTTTRPATVVLVYDIRNKAEALTWKEYENSIYIDITKIKKMDNYKFVNILILLFSPTSSFSFDNYNEDRERSYNIKKIVDSKNIYCVYGQDGLKNIARKLSSHFLKLTKNYYRTLKKSLKIKKSNSSEVKENIIKYNIKLGVVSQVKNRRRNWKYFEEAYNLLSGIDNKKYYYGSTDTKMNYLELKSVADWLFFKIVHLKSSDLNNNLQYIVNSFGFYIQHYSKVDYYYNSTESGLSPEIDNLIIIEYYWRVLRYEFFAKFLEDNGRSDFYLKNYINFPGFHYLVSFIILIF